MWSLITYHIEGRQMAIDLILTSAHHLAVFTLVGVFAAEFALLRPGIAGPRLTQLARLDAAYGVVATIVIMVGAARVIFGASGWDYYVGSHAFWGKMGAFLSVGLLTVPPSLAIRKWSRALAGDARFSPDPGEIAASRRYLHLQACFLLFILVFAAIMARG